MLNRILNKINKLYTKIRLYRTKNGMTDNSDYSFIKLVIQGTNNIIEIGDKSIIDRLTIEIKGDNNHIIIHERVKCKNGKFHIDGDSNQLIIGKDTTFEQIKICQIEDKNTITIGDDCMFSHGIVIRNGDSHSVLDLATSQRLNYSGNVTIKDHSWIGMNAIILKNVTINENSIVAANSLITKDIEANTIVGGNSAKLIKQNISWSRERI